jgi:hypothetical protein
MTLHTLSRTRGSGSLTLLGGFRDTSYDACAESENASLLIQETESSNNQFTVQLEELKQLDVDVLVDYCSPGDQRAVSEGNRRDFRLNCSQP